MTHATEHFDAPDKSKRNTDSGKPAAQLLNEEQDRAYGHCPKGRDQRFRNVSARIAARSNQ